MTAGSRGCEATVTRHLRASRPWWLAAAIIAIVLIAVADVFRGAAIFAALMVPITLTLKKVDLAGGTPAAIEGQI